ncbi:cystathionine gamma-synthase [Xylariaceae sp. FL0255]|nr:cystathionine gamma-synthase [Xylariaceae sp. FL0255]
MNKMIVSPVLAAPTPVSKTYKPSSTPSLPPLGAPVPSVPHAISCQLPKWQDVLEFASRSGRLIAAQKGGYPRSFLHQDVRKVHDFCVKNFGSEDEICFLFPSLESANAGASYLRAASGMHGESDPARVRVQSISFEVNDHCPGISPNVALHALFVPKGAINEALVYWRLTGTGISSRLAEDLIPTLSTAQIVGSENANKYGHSSDLSTADGELAYSTLRARIAEFLERAPIGGPRFPKASAKDVYLYPTGMAAIYGLTMALRDWPGTKFVVFGFPYELTLKVQEAFAKDSVFYGFGTLSEMELLEDYLHMLSQQGTSIQAVWCECASNPLLRTVDFDRLRRLADRYGFLIIVDDTIASSANVDVLGVADIVVTSLTKSFSGCADVMGGSVALNPRSPFYERLQAAVSANYRNDFYYRDAIQLEMNSRGFLARAAVMNRNASEIVDFLIPFADDPKAPLRRIYYPSTCTWSTANYEARMRPPTEEFTPGYGCLFTLDFDTVDHAAIFYDALDICKGPSLGAPVSLALPYVQVVFSKEKPWAARYGVRESIVRIAVGVEDVKVLRDRFARAIAVLMSKKL